MRSDVGVLLAIAIEIIAIDIITAGDLVDGAKNDTRVIVGDDVGVAILRFVTFEFRVLPRELFAWIDRLETTPINEPPCPAFLSYLVFLREFIIVRCFQSFQMRGELLDGDRRIVTQRLSSTDLHGFAGRSRRDRWRENGHLHFHG